jgi:hypothetical protein
VGVLGSYHLCGWKDGGGRGGEGLYLARGQVKNKKEKGKKKK